MIRNLKPRIIYLIAYLTPLVFTLLAYYYFQKIDFTRTNPDSARYLLSALMQCEAAIIAIVVTLSLLVIQLSASYSPRLVSLFEKTPELWFMVTIYISIIMSLTTLRLIGSYKNTEYVEKLINVSYFLGIFCFSALIPYTLKVINLLKPKTVISDIVKSIKKSKDVNNINREILNIFAIINGSILKCDFETAAEGLLKFLENP